jgi:hypothetical protein
MNRPFSQYPKLASAALLLAGLLMAACSSDSPSEPEQNPAPPPPPPSSTFVVSVTASPTELTANSDTPSIVTVRATRRDNGQPPPNGTTALLTTNLGDFSRQGSNQQSGVIELNNGTAQIALFADDAVGAAFIQATLEGSVGQAQVNVREQATFFVSFVSPNTGTPTGGQSVEIVGGGIQEPVRVTFDGIVAQVQSVSDTRIRVIVPPSTAPVPTGQTRAVNVQVTINLNETDQRDDTLSGGFTYVPGGGQVQQPQVFSLSPASGVNEGGTRVTIVGDGFEAPVQVLLGLGTTLNTFTGVEATVESVTRTQVVIRTPAATGFGQDNQNRTVNVVVRNLNSGFATLVQSAYRYGAGIRITSFSPQQIPYDSQATVTIDGQGFEPPVQVFLAGIEATVQSASGSRIIVRAPIPAITNCADVAGEVQVVNINSGATDDSSADPALPDFIFRVFDVVVTGISPSSGSGNGGTNVNISGTGFVRPIQVLFGTRAGNTGNVTSSSVTAVTPAFTEFTEVACDDNADGTQGMRFVATPVDLTVRNSATGCESVLEGAFTYTPTDNSCRGDQGAQPAPQCSDGIDNDGDTFIDFPNDPQCSSALDTTENA